MLSGPHLEFAVQAWTPWCQEEKELLENVQKRAVRMIAGLKSEDYGEQLKKLGLVSLEERRHRADMALVHSMMHGKTDIEVEEWYTRAATGARATRNATGAMNVVPKFGRLEKRNHFLIVRTTTAWNSVPGEVKKVNSATCIVGHR